MVKHAMRYLPGLALAGLTVAVIARKKRHEPAPPASPLVSYGRACKEFGSHARERAAKARDVRFERQVQRGRQAMMRTRSRRNVHWTKKLADLQPH
jgi:hypothetical protein